MNSIINGGITKLVKVND